MDLSHSQSSNLSLGLQTHRSDDSISFQIDSNGRDRSKSVPSVPLQLMDPTTEEESGNDEGEGAADVEEFRILGHSMCLKRRRDSESSSSSSVSRRCVEQPSLEARRKAVRAWGNQPLCVADPDVFGIMEKEKERQYKGIELIASENFVCQAVMEALGSHLTNKYSEGMPGARYYGGNEYIDEIENLCKDRALLAFGLDSETWGVNVQPYSCTSANFAVYTGLLLPGDRIMGLDTPSGGNTSHGYYTPNGRKVSGASIFFESLPYKVNPQTGLVDYDKLEERALDFRPKILICGGSSYPREWDYVRFRQIADKCGSVLMCDMAQISGLIAAKECVSPFEYCDIVTSTTHKSLRGPRGGIIFYRKGSKPKKRGLLLNQGDGSDKYDFEEKINFAVFPSLQGGPHNNHIAALAIALKQVATPEYKAYMQQVKKNAQALAAALLKKNCRLVTGGTDNHLLLWDLRNLGLTGKSFEKVFRVPPDVQQIMEESLRGVVAKKRKKQKLAEVISGFDPSTSEVDGLSGQCDLSGAVSLIPNVDVLDPNSGVLEDGPRKRGRKKRGAKKGAANTGLDVIPLDVVGGGSKRVNDQVHLAIGRFFYDVGVPLDAVNSVYFQPMLDAIASQGAVSVAPNYHDLRSGILKNSVQEVRNDINLCMSHWGHSGCSVLVDEYVSEKGKTLINFMVYCSEGTIFLRFVDVTDIMNSEDALFELLKEVVEEVGVRNVLQVITNTEDRYVVTGKRLSDTFPTVFWTPCAARCIDLMLEDFGKVKWIISILEKSKYISRFIYNHSVVLNMMRRYTYGVDLVELGVSSSATDFATLKRLVNIKPNLQSMVTSEEWMECPYSKKTEGITMLDYISNQSFWSTCSFVTRLTDPLLRLLRIVSSEKRPAMGYVNAGIYRAKESIRKEFEDKKEYEVYWNIIDGRWEHLQHHPLHAAGFYLNPKFFYGTEGSIHRHIPSSVFDCVEKMFPDPKIQDKIMKETTSYHNAAGDFGRNMAMRARETLLPAEWWSTYGGACPNLSRLALRVLSQTCSLMSCKPNRHYLEQIDKTKNCLEHQRLTDLVFVQYNLRLRQMAVKNREHDAADPISCDIINTSEDWVTENEVGMEDTGSADWMNVVPPLGHMTLLGSEIEDIEALGAAGFDDYEEVFNGVKDSEGENGEDREEDNTV